MSAFFSIIVPVYNANRYLSKCVGSILSQNHTDFELLLVDDGSTDDSGDICEKYAEKDRRVRVFHQTNGGASTARNMGLENACGEWVMFVDSDDFLCDDNALSTLRDAIVSEECCELVCYSGKVIVSGNEYVDVLKRKTYENGWQCMEDLCLQKKGIVFGSVFVQCIKKSVIDTFHLRFNDEIRYSEDRLVVCSCYLRVKKTIVLSDVLYCYVVNEGSLMRDENRRKRLDADQRKAVKLIGEQMKEFPQNLPHLRKYIHGLYLQSTDGLRRKEMDWRFIFHNASTIKLKIKDILLFLGVNKY